VCGRYGLTIDQEALSIAYAVDAVLVDHRPRYNIAPSQVVPVMLGDGECPRIDGFRWGLVPPDAPSPKLSYRTINARSESVALKPAFRGAWKRRRRCFVLADGFYEWQKPASKKGQRVPFWFRMEDDRPFGFAGLWERWSRDGESLLTCTVLTTDANALVAPVHDRMPVILGSPSEWMPWIDSTIASAELSGLLRPYSPVEMRAHAVSAHVNRAENEGPECIQPLETDPPTPDASTVEEDPQGVLEL
jgi:putative SOS response-associated peptidase YedK